MYANTKCVRCISQQTKEKIQKLKNFLDIDNESLGNEMNGSFQG